LGCYLISFILPREIAFFYDPHLYIQVNNVKGKPAVGVDITNPG